MFGRGCGRVIERPLSHAAVHRHSGGFPPPDSNLPDAGPFGLEFTDKVPAFLDSAWREGLTATGMTQQNWFKLIGSGQNLRTADDLPLALTNRPELAALGRIMAAAI